MGHRKSSSASASGQKIQRENRQGAEIADGPSEAPTLEQDTSDNSRGAGGNGIDSYGDDGSRRLEAERTALLRSKQAELDAIENSHDDLVRSCILHYAYLCESCSFCMRPYAYCLWAM